MSLLLGLYWATGSNLTVDLAQELTDGAGFCVAHQQMFGIAIWSAIGKKLFSSKGGKAKRLEDYELPGWLSIFNENIVATSVLMTLFFSVILLVLGKDYLIASGMLKEGSSFLFYILTTSLNFAVYLSILQLACECSYLRFHLRCSRTVPCYHCIGNDEISGSCNCRIRTCILR